MMDADSVKDVIRLAALLKTHWGLRAASVRALPTGHTNKTYVAEADGHTFILRVSWQGKSTRQVRDEAAVLECLADAAGMPAVPRPRRTRDGQGCLSLDGRWLHMFDVIAGQTGALGEADTDAGHGIRSPAPVQDFGEQAECIASAMRTLVRLHGAMATMPANTADPLAWLRARHARVCGRPSARPAPIPEDQHEALLLRIGDQLAMAALDVPGHVQWLHGDYHAGNLLFVERQVSGILDFDDVGQGSPWLEAAFALFALSRDVDREDNFAFDASAWDAGLQAYAEHQSDAPVAWLRDNRDRLMLLFCADQALIHLQAAQRGLWTPGPGMGFLGCVRQLLASHLSLSDQQRAQLRIA